MERKTRGFREFADLVDLVEKVSCNVATLSNRINIPRCPESPALTHPSIHPSPPPPPHPNQPASRAFRLSIYLSIYLSVPRRQTGGYVRYDTVRYVFHRRAVRSSFRFPPRSPASGKEVVSPALRRESVAEPNSSFPAFSTIACLSL